MNELRAVVVNKGGSAHLLASHGKTTLCYRQLSGPLLDAPDDAKRCVRCARRYERDEANRAQWRERQEGAEAKAEANREGRFVVYRCKLCGAQHHPSSQGTPFCIGAMHPAELEALEARGPAFRLTEAA